MNSYDWADQRIHEYFYIPSSRVNALLEFEEYVYIYIMYRLCIVQFMLKIGPQTDYSM